MKGNSYEVGGPPVPAQIKADARKLAKQTVRAVSRELEDVLYGLLLGGNPERCFVTEGYQGRPISGYCTLQGVMLRVDVDEGPQGWEMVLEDAEGRVWITNSVGMGELPEVPPSVVKEAERAQ